jgi:hypothetical protein
MDGDFILKFEACYFVCIGVKGDEFRAVKKIETP